jgi:hypothetical protein
MKDLALTVLFGMLVVLVPALFCVWVADIGGGRGVLTGLVLGMLAQAGIALVLWTPVMAVFWLLGMPRTETVIFRTSLAVFMVTTLVGLLVFPGRLGRPIGGYELAQSLALIVVFGLALRLALKILMRKPAPPARPAYAPPSRSYAGVSRRTTARASRPAPVSFEEPSIPPLWYTEEAAEEPETQRLYSDLLAKVRGDKVTAESLIEYERSRNPGASRAELIQDAIIRWERDNR